MGAAIGRQIRWRRLLLDARTSLRAHCAYTSPGRPLKLSSRASGSRVPHTPRVIAVCNSRSQKGKRVASSLRRIPLIDISR